MLKEYEYTAKTMGTDLSIAIVSNLETLANTLSSATITEIDLYEKRFSRFLPESELSKLNTMKEMRVSEMFIKVTEESYHLFKLTNGVFNPLFQIERLGYNKTFSEIKDFFINENVEEYNVDFSSVIIDKEHSKIILSPGQKLDFGGFLKGYLAELICHRIKNYSSDINGVIVNIGGDLYTEGLDAQDEKFIFNIFNPIIKQNDIPVALYNQGLATSGTYKRKWEVSGQEYNHILNETGRVNPNTDIVSVSVINKSGTKSEAFTKVFLSLGIEKATELLKGEKIEYIIIKKDGEVIKNI